MFITIKMNLASRGWLFFAAVTAAAMLFPAAAHAANPECSFEVKPVAVCEISFYKLLVAPKKYDGKYIAVTGYMAISDGRLAVYPTEMSYKLSIEQDSFSIRTPMKERESLAGSLNRHYVRIVGLFNFEIMGDNNPGIGYISKLIAAQRIDPRPDVPEDHRLTGSPAEISQ